MGVDAKKQAHQGRDVKLCLFVGGKPLDVIEAEEIDLKPVIKSVEREILSEGQTSYDTHGDGWTITVKGVKTSNAFLKHIREAMKANRDDGLAFPKYTVNITYFDKGAGKAVKEKFKLADASLLDVDSFNSGSIFSKQMQGFSMHGKDGNA